MPSNLWSCTAMALTNQGTFGETEIEIKYTTLLRLTDFIDFTYSVFNFSLIIYSKFFESPIQSMWWVYDERGRLATQQIRCFYNYDIWWTIFWIFTCVYQAFPCEPLARTLAKLNRWRSWLGIWYSDSSERGRQSVNAIERWVIKEFSAKLKVKLT